MARSGGFRLNVVGLRAGGGASGLHASGKDIRGGQFVSPEAALAKGIDAARKSALAPAGDALLKELKRLTPKYKPDALEEQRGTYPGYLDKKLRAGWEKSSGVIPGGSRTTIGIELYNAVRAPGLTSASLVEIVDAGTAPHTITAARAPFLVFPRRGGGTGGRGGSGGGSGGQLVRRLSVVQHAPARGFIAKALMGRVGTQALDTLARSATRVILEAITGAD